MERKTTVERQQEIISFKRVLEPRLQSIRDLNYNAHFGRRRKNRSRIRLEKSLGKLDDVFLIFPEIDDVSSYFLAIQELLNKLFGTINIDSNFPREQLVGAKMKDYLSSELIKILLNRLPAGIDVSQDMAVQTSRDFSGRVGANLGTHPIQ